MRDVSQLIAAKVRDVAGREEQGLTAGTRPFVEGHSDPTASNRCCRLAVNIRAHLIRRRRGGDRVKVLRVGRHQVQTSSRPLAENSGRTQPELRIPGAAAQTRVVCVAGIRLGSGNPRELSKG